MCSSSSFETLVIAILSRVPTALSINHHYRKQILFLCYDLIAGLHTTASEDEKKTTHRQLVFWTDQLKRAVQCRYGPLGHDLGHVRRILQHCRIVCRQPNGMDLVEHKFI